MNDELVSRRGVADTLIELGSAARAEFLLDPDVVFLNHGSFGAVPRAVLATQDEWRRRVERQPVRFLVRELGPALRQAADSLGDFLGVSGCDLVFVDNATAAINTVLRSLPLAPGDEVLHTNHGYGAVKKAIRFACERAGATPVEAHVPFPITDADEVVQAVAAGMSARTRLAVIDHVTSPTALVWPVERIAALCRERGVRVLIDGAHAPGMLPLDIAALGADYYAGNCHKWLFAAKGTGFLWAAPQRQAALHPLVVSWGHGDGFAKAFDWPGTRDFSGWLAVPAAIEFHRRLGGEALCRRNNALAADAAERLCTSLGVTPAAPSSMRAAMVTIRLPTDQPGTRAVADSIHDRLSDEHRIEVPIIDFADRLWVRISAQCYNELPDYARLGEVLPTVIRDCEADS
jgi:isopenicillin-N epimerase